MTTQDNATRNDTRLVRQRGMSLVDVLIVVAVVGLLAANGVSAMLWALDLARLSKSAYAVRVVAQAVTEYQTAKRDLAPGFYKVSDISAKLATFVDGLPTTDAWRNPVYVEVFPGAALGDDDDDDEGGINLALGHFRVYSFGKDGTPDAEVVTGVWVDFNSDLVIQDGIFIQTKW